VSKSWTIFYRHDRWCGVKPRCFMPIGPQWFYLLTADGCIGMSYVPFQGVFRQARWSRSVERNEAGYGAEWTARRPSVRKVKLADRASVKHLAALETEALRDYMAVIEHLALLQYEDGTPRKGGFLMIWTEGSQWRVKLLDNDADAFLPCVGRTFDEALGTLTLMLGAEDAPWEPNRRHKGGKGGKG
jgi:hypothetical protein